jgi:hypothetical protein
MARPVGTTIPVGDPYQGGVEIKTPFNHTALFVHQGGQVIRQFSLQFGNTRFDPQGSTSETYLRDLEAFRNPGGADLSYPIAPPEGVSAKEFADSVTSFGDAYLANPETYRLFQGPNSNSAAAFPLIQSGAKVPGVPNAPALNFYAPR